MKKLLILICGVALLNGKVAADTVTYVFDHQEENTANTRPIKYTEVDVEPIFTGLSNPPTNKIRIIKGKDTSLFNPSRAQFRMWVMEQVENPQELEGRMRVSFIVTPQGNVTNVKILESLDSALDAEVERIVWSSPKWKAGQHGGKPVAVAYAMPLNFKPKKNEPTRRRVTKDSTLYDVTRVKVAPTFLGGNKERFGAWIVENLRYPKKQDKTQFPEARIMVSFVIDTSGVVTNVKVLRGSQHEMADEVRRVIQRSPKWTPGMVNGKPVRVVYLQPVTMQY